MCNKQVDKNCLQEFVPSIIKEITDELNIEIQEVYLMDYYKRCLCNECLKILGITKNEGKPCLMCRFPRLSDSYVCKFCEEFIAKNGRINVG